MKRRTKKRCLLISAPWADFRGPSIAIGSLAAYAKARGFNVDAHHMHLLVAAEFGFMDYDRAAMSTPHCLGEAMCAAELFPSRKDTIKKYVWRYQPHLGKKFTTLKRSLRKAYADMGLDGYDIIGFTVNYQQLFSSLLLAEWIKRDHPHVKILMGGRCVAGELGKSVLKRFDQIDWCIDGEGEEAFTALLDELMRRESGFEKCIPGLMYREDGKILMNARRQLASLEGLPDPDYDSYFDLIETHPVLKETDITPHIAVEESRGCIYRCAFCTDHPYWHGYRARPPSEIADSIMRLSRKHGIDSIYLVSSLITPKSCEELFPLIASHGRDYRIFCEIRANLTKEHLKQMKRAGICEVFAGIEALDTKLLGKMNKGTRLIDNLKIMKFCEELGIKCSSIFLIAFPTETQADVDRSISAIDYTCAFYPIFNLFTFKLLDGSPVHRSPKKFGIVHVDENAVFDRLLPKEVRMNIVFWYKNFKSRYPRRNYRALRARRDVWEMRYNDAQVLGRPMLYYMDCGVFLRIDDSRNISSSVTLEGMARDIYLFCDTIRSLKEIDKKFSDYAPDDIKKCVDELFEMKLMYMEDGLYLSLAIHSGASRRVLFPFI